MSDGPPWSYSPCFQKIAIWMPVAGPGVPWVTNRTRRAFSSGSLMIQPAPSVASGIESSKAEKTWYRTYFPKSRPSVPLVSS